jgi:hypothetical protein
MARTLDVRVRALEMATAPVVVPLVIFRLIMPSQGCRWVTSAFALADGMVLRREKDETDDSFKRRVGAAATQGLKDGQSVARVCAVDGFEAPL